MTIVTPAVLAAALLAPAPAPVAEQQDAERRTPWTRLIPTRGPVETGTADGKLPAAPQLPPATGQDPESPDERPRCLMPIVPADPSIDSRMVVKIAPAQRPAMPVIEVGCQP